MSNIATASTVLYTHVDKDDETVTLYSESVHAEYPYIDTEGDSGGVLLPPLEAYKLALALIESANTALNTLATRQLQDLITDLEYSQTIGIRQALLNKFDITVPAASLGEGFCELLDYTLKLESTKNHQ